MWAELTGIMMFLLSFCATEQIFKALLCMKLIKLKCSSNIVETKLDRI